MSFLGGDGHLPLHPVHGLARSCRLRPLKFFREISALRIIEQIDVWSGFRSNRLPVADSVLIVPMDTSGGTLQCGVQLAVRDSWISEIYHDLYSIACRF